jgi:biopolymer transport protein ExbD
MKFREKHNSEAEVFTEALNDIIFILLMFFLITTTMANPNVVKVNNPRGTKDTKSKQNIVVSIDKGQKVYIGQKPIDINNIDTILHAELARIRKSPLDTPSVVVNADTIAYYGEVYRIMQAAKRAGAKVVAVVR